MEQLQLLISLGMVNLDYSTEQFSDVGVAVPGSEMCGCGFVYWVVEKVKVQFN